MSILFCEEKQQEKATLQCQCCKHGKTVKQQQMFYVKTCGKRSQHVRLSNPIDTPKAENTKK